METVDNHKTLSHYAKDTDGRTSAMCSMGEITLDNQRLTKHLAHLPILKPAKCAPLPIST